MVGATGAESGVNGVLGALYVFVRSNGEWSPPQKLHTYGLPPPTLGGIAEYLFPSSVAISGDTIVAGAPDADPLSIKDAGVAFVYARSNGEWSQASTLMASDMAEEDGLGTAVAISGDTVVVSAIGEGNRLTENFGAAYVFVRNSNGQWAEQAKLTASDAANLKDFGRSVAISGDTVVVGAPNDDSAAGVDAGSAYAFVRSNGQWSQHLKLTASDKAKLDTFGTSVAISSDTIVAGAPGKNSAAGAAYIKRLVNFVPF